MIQKSHVMEIIRLENSGFFEANKGEKRMAPKLAEILDIDIESVFFIADNYAWAVEWANSNNDISFEEFIDTVKTAEEV